MTNSSAFEKLNNHLNGGNGLYGAKAIDLQIEALRELETKITGSMIISCKESFQARCKNDDVAADVFFQSLKLVRMINHQHAILSILANAKGLIDDPKKKTSLELLASEKMQNILEHNENFSKLMRSVLFTLRAE